MYNILRLRDSVQGYISIIVSEDGEEKTYTVRVSVYEELGSPKKAAALTEENMHILRDADEYYRGKRAALSILSYGDNNAKTLLEKLCRRSISEETGKKIVGEMISLGYIDEKRQLERLILEDSNRKFLGPRKIFPRLLAKGYSASDIKEVYNNLSRTGEINLHENKERLLEKHFGSDRDAENVRRILFKYGYDF